MEIRKYNSDDFEKVVEILIDSFPESSSKINDFLTCFEKLELDINKYIQLVAIEDSTVVGYVLVTRSNDPIIGRGNYWIDYVWVDKDYRGRGFAKALLIEIDKIAQNENVLYLQLTSSRSRTVARKIYMDLGFENRESVIFRKVL